MNEAFEATLNVQTTGDDIVKGKDLSLFNIIDVGTITSVHNGVCSVQSYKIINGLNLVYTDLELIYPGGTGSYNPEGMSCIVFFPAEATNLREGTISSLKTYFSVYGGKVLPLSVAGDCDVKVGPSSDGSFSFESDKISITVSKENVFVLIDSGKSLNMLYDKDHLSISMFNGSLLFAFDTVTSTIRKSQFNNGTPFLYEFNSPTEHWIGHVGYKAMSHNDIKYDITKYVKTDFNFVEDFISTEQWIYIYKNDGSVLASLCIDNTGEIYVGTEEKITVEAKKDVTVNRDGTKLEVKNGKVVITGDLEVNGKATISDTATITGMKTDVQRFFADLTSAMNSMFTLGSPATHQMDGAFKSNLAILRSKL